MKKIISLFLILALSIPQGCLGVVFAEGNSGKTVLEDNQVIWNGDGSNLNVKNGDTVTVTKASEGWVTVPAGATITIVGSVKSGARDLCFDLNSGATVRWGAEYRGTHTHVDVMGKGTFEIIDGAFIENTSGEDDTITSTDKNTNFIINGGYILTKGKNGSSVFTLYSDVVINGGIIENRGKNGSTICARNIKMTDGKVLANKDTFMAMYAVGISKNGGCDRVNGNVTVLGGEVSSKKHTAIEAWGLVSIRGGIISSTGDEATIISSGNDYGGIKVSGGVITSTASDCILANYISVKGGVIFASKGYALTSSDNSKNSFSNRTLHAKSSSKKSKAKISGGLILARGKSLSDVIDTKSIKISNLKNKGIICTWNKNGKTRYKNGSRTNLKVYTPKASVKWSKKGKLSGLSYKKGSKKGFVRIKGIKVVNPKPKKK